MTNLRQVLKIFSIAFKAKIVTLKIYLKKHKSKSSIYVFKGNTYKPFYLKNPES